MCGRFTLRASAQVVAEQFDVFASGQWEPRYNIAPSQPVAVVRAAAAASRELTWRRWGLVPAWSKDPAIGNRLINARAETAAEKPAFRTAFRRRRCLIVADGFYEWQRAGKRKQPYFIRFQDDRPFAFAGLWESWEGADYSAVESCAILTTAANELMRPIHDRMPVLLAPADYARWLDPAVARPESLMPLLRPYSGDEMRSHPVSPLVNNPANDDPQCVSKTDFNPSALGRS
jgi:putative SOS response-associated peptidase YedK